MEKDLAIPVNSQEDPAHDTAKTTIINVVQTADKVQDHGSMAAVAAGVIQGPVIINVTGPAADLAAVRRATAQALRSPVLSLRAFEPETLLIPAGPFLMGTDAPEASPWERQQHTVRLPDYRIGKYPVTNAQYAEFVAQQPNPLHFAPPRQADWQDLRPPDDRAKHPITWLNWSQAAAYCSWLSEQTGRAYHLPSEAEWEKAASWGTGVDKKTGGQENKIGKRMYPWGEKWIEGRCNAASSGTMPVTMHPDGASAYGCQDMLGNVEEWTSTAWGSNRESPRYPYPYLADDGREEAGPDRASQPLLRLHRGGSYRSPAATVRCTARGVSSPATQAPWRGFRVAMTV